jgi:tetratricopeptide (TPR) repeat protein
MAWQVMANALHAQGSEADAARALDNHCAFDGAAAQLRYLAGELDERPDDADLLAKAGAAYLRLNMANQAEDALTRALSLDPNHAAARQLLQQMRRRGRAAR